MSASGELKLILFQQFIPFLPQRQIQSSRTHECNTGCWCSIDCNHQGQTALHSASANSILAVVSCLLDAGANPNLPNAQGYTALYYTLVQEHKDIACCILQHCEDTINPIVNTHKQTTALHMASRFSFPEIVYKLLKRGAYANIIDSHGRTPLHDVLTWSHSGQERELLITLEYLFKFHADPDTTAHHPTPRQIVKTHSCINVRDLFLAPQKQTRVCCTRPLFSKQSETHAPNSPDNTDISGANRKAKSPKLPHSLVPHQIHSKLEESIWAPHRTSHLAKILEAGMKSPDLDKTVATQEPFPDFITKTECNINNFAPSVTGV